MKFKGLAMALLAGIFFAGCTSGAEETKVEKQKEYIEEGLGGIKDYGQVTVISEAKPFVLEENESLSYELSGVKIIKLEKYTEHAEFPLTLKHGVLDINEVPESLYMVIGTEKMKNKTDSSIVFGGAYKMKEGSNMNVNINTEDILFGDDFGAVMVSGADQKSQFAVVINNPEVTTLSFTLPSAWDEKNNEEDILEEQEFTMGFIKK
ncbi:hypothetical protein ACFPRA_21885 [Sporosarcina soli]|uniref:Lipoprotein n=1 Tax=Sporosarcina soli TaxID=334736 RepID=A0ABW0TRK5_9BACL